MWWRSFEQAGHKSWEALIPGYNYFVAFKIGSKKPWWALLMVFPGVHLVMWAVANTSYIRRFGYYSIADTAQGIFFPYIIMAKIAQSKEDFLPETNWANSKELSDREWGDHLALFLTLPVIGHVLAMGIGAVTRHKPGEKSKVKEWGDSLMFALVAAGIIRTYVFEPFQIPTGSMEKTLLVGDFLFVNKLAYGPKVPVTPLSYPLVHNNVPWVNVKSYTGLETCNYTRLPGFTDVSRNDVVVFNYPSGDTAVYDPRVPSGLMGHDYHGILIDEAKYYWKNTSQNLVYRKAISKKMNDTIRVNNPQLSYDAKELNEYCQKQAYYFVLENLKGQNFIDSMDYWKDVARKGIASGVTYCRQTDDVFKFENTPLYHKGLIPRPVDKRENYIKRCVGLPGDWLEIKQSILYVNNQKAMVSPTQNLEYNVSNINLPEDKQMVIKYGLENHRGNTVAGDYHITGESSYTMQLTLSQLKKLKKNYPEAKFKLSLVPFKEKNAKGGYSPLEALNNLNTFPKDLFIDNNVTNFNKFQIPFKGQTIKINADNIAWFRRIISAYEGHKLIEKEDGIYIDGVKINEYTFAMNYYWLMGDNRYNSADSRIWGFVPQDHIVGKASMVWFSKDPIQGIRWERLFNFIN